MSNRLDQVLEIILNKKFIKPKNANIDCYDCEDVDAFFDEMSEFIRNVYKQLETLVDTNTKLEQEILTLREQNDKLLKQNQELINNGYEKVAKLNHK